MTAAPALEKDSPIVATAGRYYRNTRYLISIFILVGMGLWFAYDGYVKYPRQNQEILDLRVQEKAAKDRNDSAESARIGALLATREFHNDKALLFQRMLGWILPPLGIALFIWTLYNSRGAIRFSGDTLEAPGHPPVKLTEMKSLDRALWERKGIAYIDYETAAGARGKIRLDDFVYDRPPTDAIYDCVKAHFYPDEVDEGDGDEKSSTV